MSAPADSFAKLRTIKDATAAHFNVPPAAFDWPDKSPRGRERKFARPRQVAMAIAHERGGNRTLQWIGRHFGGRDHTTVLHAVRRVRELAQDPDFARDLQAIREAVDQCTPANWFQKYRAQHDAAIAIGAGIRAMGQQAEWAWLDTADAIATLAMEAANV